LPEYLAYEPRWLRELTGICGSTRTANVFGLPSRDDSKTIYVGLVRMMTATGVANVVKHIPQAFVDADGKETVKAFGFGPRGTKFICSRYFLDEQLELQKTALEEEINTEDADANANGVTPLVRKILDMMERIQERYKEALEEDKNPTAKPKSTLQIEESRPQEEHDYDQKGDDGLYDDEVDPLKTPEVLAAVREFKTRLDARDANLRQKRVEMVDKLLEQKTQFYREKLKEEREQQSRLPPPPMPPGPHPGTLGSSALDSGKRPISNLPAWMTSQESNKRKLDGTEEQPPNSRPKTDSTENHALSMEHVESLSKEELFSLSLPWAEIKDLGDKFDVPLRKWVAQKTVEYLGEEEETMIDFVMDQVKDSNADSKAILDEMETVLDDTAEDFVIQLWQILVVPKLWLDSLDTGLSKQTSE